MTPGFNDQLASALNSFVTELRSDTRKTASYKQSPTEAVVAYLKEKKVHIPEMFHAHAVTRGNPLPEEPKLATVDRFVYIFRKDGLFEFKKVPGSPEGDDSILNNASLGACCCCNCCAVEV